MIVIAIRHSLPQLTYMTALLLRETECEHYSYSLKRPRQLFQPNALYEMAVDQLEIVHY